MDDSSIDLSQMIERLHRRYLDVVRVELDRMGCRDLTPVQAVLLANVGEDEVVMKELIERGYYQGSNVSYNMKKLVEFGYIEQARSQHDKRSVRVRLTDKSKAVCDRIRKMKALDGPALERAGIGANEFANLVENLRRLENAWSELVRYRR